MSKPYNVYNNLGYWFLIYIVLVIGGFYQSYFSVIFNPFPRLIHFHFALMIMWIVMMIAQPFLIKYKKLSWHRIVGKASYVLVPALLISAYLVSRGEYIRTLQRYTEESSKAAIQLSRAELLQKTALFGSIAQYYTLLFVIFYALAIWYRKRSLMHARFMVATSLTMLGPTVDRIMINVFDMHVYPLGLPIEVLAFSIADLVLAYLLFRDYKSNKPMKALATALGIMLIAQILYFTLQDSAIFSAYMAMIYRP